MIFPATGILFALAGTLPALPPCVPRPFPVDPVKIQQMKDVDKVVADAGASMVTVLFSNGDVLRLRAKPKECEGPGLMISASFWSYHAVIPHERVKLVTDLILPPKMAEQIDRDIANSKDNWLAGWGLRFEGKTEAGLLWVATMKDSPGTLSGMGRMVEIDYLFPPGIDEPIRE
jgi:hypothetical protein